MPHRVVGVRCPGYGWTCETLPIEPTRAKRLTITKGSPYIWLRPSWDIKLKLSSLSSSSRALSFSIIFMCTSSSCECVFSKQVGQPSYHFLLGSRARLGVGRIMVCCILRMRSIEPLVQKDVDSAFRAVFTCLNPGQRSSLISSFIV